MFHWPMTCLAFTFLFNAFDLLFLTDSKSDGSFKGEDQLHTLSSVTAHTKASYPHIDLGFLTP